MIQIANYHYPDYSTGADAWLDIAMQAQDDAEYERETIDMMVAVSAIGAMQDNTKEYEGEIAAMIMEASTPGAEPTELVPDGTRLRDLTLAIEYYTVLAVDRANPAYRYRAIALSEARNAMRKDLLNSRTWR